MDIQKVTQLVQEYVKDADEAAVHDFIYADWDNWNADDHDGWLKTASNEEIADWVIDGLR